MKSKFIFRDDSLGVGILTTVAASLGGFLLGTVSGAIFQRKEDETVRNMEVSNAVMTTMFKTFTYSREAVKNAYKDVDKFDDEIKKSPLSSPNNNLGAHVLLDAFKRTDNELEKVYGNNKWFKE